MIIPKRFVCPKCGASNTVSPSLRQQVKKMNITGSLKLRCAAKSLTFKQCPGIVEFKPTTVPAQTAQTTEV